jgi:hypothetical protein
MKIVISKWSSCYTVDPVDMPGSPMVGRGDTMDEAIAAFVRCYQHDLGLDIVVDETAMPTELERRRRELAKR